MRNEEWVGTGTSGIGHYMTYWLDIVHGMAELAANSCQLTNKSDFPYQSLRHRHPDRANERILIPVAAIPKEFDFVASQAAAPMHSPNSPR
jgi:hypothetical protein